MPKEENTHETNTEKLYFDALVNAMRDRRRSKVKITREEMVEELSGYSKALGKNIVTQALNFSHMFEICEEERTLLVRNLSTAVVALIAAHTEHIRYGLEKGFVIPEPALDEDFDFREYMKNNASDRKD